MVITEPNKLAAEVHARMPVILEADDFEQWERGDVKDAAALMKPADEHVLQKWRVSKRENSSRAVVNAILYIASTGCQWRQLPEDLPPYSTV